MGLARIASISVSQSELPCTSRSTTIAKKIRAVTQMARGECLRNAGGRAIALRYAPAFLAASPGTDEKNPVPSSGAGASLT